MRAHREAGRGRRQTSVELARWMASSNVLYLMIDMTGPKISSRAIFMPSVTLVKMVGSR